MIELLFIYDPHILLTSPYKDKDHANQSVNSRYQGICQIFGGIRTNLYRKSLIIFFVPERSLGSGIKKNIWNRKKSWDWYRTNLVPKKVPVSEIFGRKKGSVSLLFNILGTVTHWLEMDYPHWQIDHKMSYLSEYLKAEWINVWDLGLAIHDS